MNALRQKRIITSVRPARVAVFVRENDPYWQATCSTIIEFFSATWGGGYNIVVPINEDGETIKKPFWDILDVYDPDYLFLYYYSGADIKRSDPEKYERWLDEHLQQFIRSGPVSNVDSARNQIDEQLRHSALLKEPEPQLQRKLIKTLAPFHLAEHAFSQSIGIGSYPHFPLSPLTKLLPNIEHSDRLSTYQPRYEGFYSLWLASITGLVSEAFARELDPIGVRHETIPANDYGPVDLFIYAPDAANRRTQSQVITPFELANIDTGLYQPVKAMAEPMAIVIVTGDTLVDFCLYYSLSKLRQSVLWLPVKSLTSQSANGGARVLLDDYADLLRDFAQLRQRQRDPQYVLLSASADTAELDSTLQLLDAAGYGRSQRISDSVVLSPNIRELLQYPLRLYEQDNAYRPSSLTVTENSQFDFFDTPRPKNLLRLDPYENRWIAEIKIQSHQLPRNARLGQWVIKDGLLSTTGARISKSGLAYFCPSPAYFGGDIDTTLVRPSIFVPDALQVFEHLFQLEGYDAKVSDKGFFARDTVEKFGTLAVLANLLRQTSTREMLLKFLDHTKPAQGVRDEGAVLNDKRRYLNLPAISKVLGNDSAAQKTIEVLVLTNVLYRGFVLKCRFCRNADWFSLDELSQNFKCKRCGRIQGIMAVNYWYGDHEPGWFYKLDEIVYQFLCHNGYVTLLALDYLRGKAEESFLYAPDMEIKKRGAANVSVELDILCIPDGVIVIGEAKKENRLGSTKRQEIATITEYNRLAEQLGADALVFATFADRWSENTENYIRTTVDDRNVILLTRTQLLATE